MNNEPKARMDLDPEMLAAYIDKRLSPEQRAAVEDQLANDPDSHAVLVETMKALEEVPQVRAVPGVPKGKVLPARWWVIVAGSIAAAAIALAIVQPQWLKRIVGDGDPRLERLVAAVGQQRYIEPRLTGGFAYGPLRSAMRGTTDLSQQNLELLAAAGELQKAAALDASSANLHRWGVAQLQLGDYDGAVAALQRAAEEDDPSGRVRTDFAAALMARAAAGRTQDLTDAVSIMQQVAALPAAPNELFFNLALALEQLGLAKAAIDAWGRAVAIEPEESPWRSEAQRHREALLERQKVSRDSQWQGIRRQLLAGDVTLVPEASAQFAQESRELLEDLLIAQFGRSCIEEATPDCTQISGVTHALAEHRANAGDRLSLDAIQRLEELARRDRRQASRLVGAHVTYGEGRQKFEGPDPISSLPLFLAAAQTFRELKSPFEFWSRNYALSADYFSARYVAALAGSDRLLADLEGVPYPVVSARTHWLRGLVTFIQGDFEQSLSDYVSAGAAYEAAREIGNAASVVSLRGEVETYLGSVDDAWRHRVGSLTKVSAINNVRRRHTLLLSGSLFALRSGNPIVAELIADAALANAQGSNNPALMAEAALHRARSLHASGRLNDSRAALSTAWASLEGAPASVANRLRAEVMLTQSEVSAENGTIQPDLASQAGAFLTSVGAEFRLPAVERIRARLAVSAGDLPTARESYRRALGLSAAQRERLRDEHRLSFVDDSWDLLDEAAATERQAGASVTDTLGFVDSQLDPRGAVSQQLADREALIRFLVLPRETLVLVRTQSNEAGVAIPVARDEVQALSDHFERAIRSSVIVSDDAGSRLWSLLFAPLEQHLRQVDTIYIVPDGPLYRVPFAALPDAQRRPLVNTFAIMIAPARSGASILPAARTAELELFVVAAEGGSAATSGLAFLPEARAEVAELSKQYQNATVATGEMPLEKLVALAEHSRLLHFAGHAEANAVYPANSWLHIGSSGKDRLFAHEIEKWRLHPRAVVVLAACETGRGRVSRSEGVASLAGAFLTAGAAAVIATSWQVPDREARAMSGEIHRHLRAGVSAARAVQRAQLARMAAGDPANVWLAFGAYGRALSQTPNTD
jgi:CHAT domain-containing protein